MTTVRIASVRYPVTVLGPGTRLGIWFQGCHIGCKGCISLDTWDPAAVVPTTTDELIDRAARLSDGRITGITISGGEPFEQSEALASLVAGLRRAFRSTPQPIDILCYSGFPLRTLERTGASILEMLDAIIAAPFRVDVPTDLPWLGSGNQRLVLLTPLAEERYRRLNHVERSVQLDVGGGRLEVIGIPRNGDLERVEQRLAAAGINVRSSTWRA